MNNTTHKLFKVEVTAVIKTITMSQRTRIKEKHAHRKGENTYHKLEHERDRNNMKSMPH